MSGTTKEKGPVVRAFSNTSQIEKCSSRAVNVVSIDRRVNNCIQHLLILWTPATRSERFTCDVHAEKAITVPLLGFRHWQAIGRPFETFVRPDGMVIAWCDEPLPRRTARQNCLKALVERMTTFLDPVEVQA